MKRRSYDIVVRCKVCVDINNDILVIDFAVSNSTRITIPFIGKLFNLSDIVTVIAAHVCR